MLEDVHMVQIQFDGRELARAEGRHGLGRNRDDLGYLAHAQLAACFGELAPKPFHVRSRRRGLEVLGYGSADADELRRRAEEFAEPAFAGTWSDLQSKEMKLALAPGRRFGFEVRVCPVVRLASDRELPLRARKEGETTGLHRFRAGSEVDVYLRDLGEEGLEAGATRRESYERWLREQMAPAVDIVNLDLLRFQLSQLFRRTQGRDRKGRRLKRPDATFTGDLEVREPSAFASLLAQGVGRHRAFGFGMLLLRPPS